MKQFYIHTNGQQSGPFTLEELKNQSLKQDTPVWYEGLPNWQKAGEIEELASLLNTTPPPYQDPKPPISPTKAVTKEQPGKYPKTKFWSYLRLTVAIAIIAYIAWLYYDDRKKTDTKENIRSLVRVGNNAYQYSKLGGIYGLELNVYNNSDYVLTKVTVKLDYIKANGEIWQTKYLDAFYIQPHSKETIKAPDSDRGTSIHYEIVAITAPAIDVYE